MREEEREREVSKEKKKKWKRGGALAEPTPFSFQVILLCFSLDAPTIAKLLRETEKKESTRKKRKHKERKKNKNDAPWRGCSRR